MKDNKHVQAILSTVLTQAQTRVQKLAAALVFYKSVKMAAAQDIPGAKAVCE